MSTGAHDISSSSVLPQTGYSTQVESTFEIEKGTEVIVVEFLGLQLSPGIFSSSEATGVELIGVRTSGMMHLVTEEARGASEVTDDEVNCAIRL
jgi:hypothetical protein